MKKLTLLLAFGLLTVSLRAKADDDFKFHGKVLVTGGAFEQTKSPQSQLFVISGCGADNQKCSCSWDANSQQLSMDGRGTSGTATGLDFTCNWLIYTTNGSCLIKWRVDIPHSGDNGTNFVLTNGCQLVSGFEPKIACGGHDFSINTAIQMDGQQSGGAFSNVDKGSCGS